MLTSLLTHAGIGIVAAAWSIYRLKGADESYLAAARRVITLGGGPRPTIPK